MVTIDVAVCPDCGLRVATRGLHVHQRRAHSDTSPPHVVHRHARWQRALIHGDHMWCVECSCGWLSRLVLRDNAVDAERSWLNHALAALNSLARDDAGRFTPKGGNA